MKTMTRKAELTKSSLANLPSYIKSYIFIEYKDSEWDKGMIYEKIVNGVSEIIKSKKNEYNELVADARKALYQKQLRGVGQFNLTIFN